MENDLGEDAEWEAVQETVRLVRKVFEMEVEMLPWKGKKVWLVKSEMRPGGDTQAAEVVVRKTAKGKRVVIHPGQQTL